MKRNGAGLASICILSTMVLVMLSSTISLFSGIQTSTFIRSRDISVTLTYNSFEDKTIRNISNLCNVALDTAKSNDHNPVNTLSYDYLEVGGYFSDNTVHLAPATDSADVSQSEIKDFYFITLEDYNKTSGRNETLSDGEILTASSDSTDGEIILDGKKYKSRQLMT